LLAQVYFRLGLYPRAIAIYEQLASNFPDELTPRINLSLCYLKTGQPERAREHLEHVVVSEPSRQRAWAYLGLAFERLGDYEKARAAFDRAGYSSMARRMEVLVDSSSAQHEAPSSSKSDPNLHEVRRVAEAAFHELDASDGAFCLASSTPQEDSKTPGTWVEVELGRPDKKAITAIAPAPFSESSSFAQPTASAPLEPEQPVRHALPLQAWTQAYNGVFSRNHRSITHADGTLLVSVHNEFATREDLVEAFVCFDIPQARENIPREQGGDPSLPLGGSNRPLLRVQQTRHIVLHPRVDRVLQAVMLEHESFMIREECLGAFDLDLSHDYGRLASGLGDTISLVHLRGTGLVVLDLPTAFMALEVQEKQGCVLRCSSLIGWTGRIVARCLPAHESPAAMRGWTGISGQGTVFLASSHNTLFS
jgi:hypothetical protein